jgi:hypothetical protein
MPLSWAFKASSLNIASYQRRTMMSMGIDVATCSGHDFISRCDLEKKKKNCLVNSSLRLFYVFMGGLCQISLFHKSTFANNVAYIVRLITPRGDLVAALPAAERVAMVVGTIRRSMLRVELDIDTGKGVVTPYLNQDIRSLHIRSYRLE